MSLASFFTTLFYQPFFNILVFFYWLLGWLTAQTPDMGIAVILLTILIRIVLLPSSIAGFKKEPSKREITQKLRELQLEFAQDPIGYKKARKRLFTKHRPIFIGEVFNLAIQVIIALMLWRVFARGLEGADLHLIYDFMPKINLPFNLLFLGRYDLAHTSFVLNFVQSLSIFILETLSVLTSPYPPTRGEIIRMQLILPVVSFLIFMGLPAGKKLFVITTLWFSILLKIIFFIRRSFLDYRQNLTSNKAIASVE